MSDSGLPQDEPMRAAPEAYEEPRDDRSSRSPVPAARDERPRSRSRSRSPPPRRYEAPAPRRPPNAPVAEPTNVLGVFGLSIRTTERDLEDEFSRSGKVEKVVVVYDARSDRSRGFGFVTMSSIEEAERAIADLNGLDLQGRRIRVDFSATKRPHDPTPGFYKGERRDDDFARGPPGGGRGGGYRGDDRWASGSRGGGDDRWAQGSRGGGYRRDDDRYGSFGGGRRDDRYASSRGGGRRDYGGGRDRSRSPPRRRRDSRSPSPYGRDRRGASPPPRERSIPPARDW